MLQVAKSTDAFAATANQSTVPVYHIVNNDRTRSWKDLLRWTQKLSPQPFEIVSPSQWIERLEQLRGEDAEHPAMKLLGLWKDAVRLWLHRCLSS